MTKACVKLCQLAFVTSLAGCFSAHSDTPMTMADASVDGIVSIDAGPLDSSILDASHVDAAWTCPSDLPVWNGNTSCEHEGQNCSAGSPSVCGSAYSCNCHLGFWTCAIAEPDPACWCGRYPSLGSECNTEEQECPSPASCDPSRPNLVCQSGHWIADPLNNELCAPPTVCPADADLVLGDPCATEGTLCSRTLCCELPTVPGHELSHASLVCDGGVWVDARIEADCIPEIPMCNVFLCGTGFCMTDEICVQSCGPADGPQFDCYRVSPLDCGGLWGSLGRPPASCTTDSEGHLRAVIESFCG